MKFQKNIFFIFIIIILILNMFSEFDFLL